MDGLLVAGYNGTASLSDLTGTVTPTNATFTNGTWTGSVTIGSARSGDRLTAADGYANGQSNAFDVTVPAPQYSLWDTAPSTGFWNSGDPQSVELGTRFRSSMDGQVTALRFFKDAGNNSAHVGHLWTNTGTLLATAAFTNETASGWQTAQLSEPVAITKDTSYVVSYHTITYHKTEGYFSSQSHTNGPLTALRSGVLTGTPAPTGNGLYAYGTSAAFPNNTYMATNYWADVVFEATPTNDAPVAVDDSYTTSEDTSLVLDATVAGTHDSPVDNDTDADTDTLTVTAVSNAAGGTVSLVSRERSPSSRPPTSASQGSTASTTRSPTAS